MLKKTKLYNDKLTVLWIVFQLQAVKARDVVEGLFNGKKSYYKMMERLEDDGYLKRTYTVTKKGKKDQSVYHITDKGIEELLTAKKITKARRARDLMLTGYSKLNRLEISKVCIYLSKSGWRFLGSKDAKIEYSLHPGSMLHCVLITPDEEIYQVYQMNKDIEDNTLQRMIKELEENRYGSIILYKSDYAGETTRVLSKIIETIEDENIPVNELCMVPNVETEKEKYNLAIEMLKYSTDENVFRYLLSKYTNVKYIANRYTFGKMAVEYKGEECLVCNYLRRDYVALDILANQLVLREYEQNKQKAIVLTWKGYAEEVQAKLDSVQPGRDFIEVIPVTRQEMRAFNN